MLEPYERVGSVIADPRNEVRIDWPEVSSSCDSDCNCARIRSGLLGVCVVQWCLMVCV